MSVWYGNEEECASTDNSCHNWSELLHRLQVTEKWFNENKTNKLECVPFVLECESYKIMWPLK